MVSHPSKCFFVLVFLEEIEKEVKGEADQNSSVNEFQDRALLDFEGYVENSGQAGIADDDKNGGIKDGLPLTVHADYKIFRFETVSKGDLFIFTEDLVFLCFMIVLVLFVRVAADVLPIQLSAFGSFANKFSYILDSV